MTPSQNKVQIEQNFDSWNQYISENTIKLVNFWKERIQYYSFEEWTVEGNETESYISQFSNYAKFVFEILFYFSLIITPELDAYDFEISSNQFEQQYNDFLGTKIKIMIADARKQYHFSEIFERLFIFSSFFEKVRSTNILKGISERSYWMKIGKTYLKMNFPDIFLINWRVTQKEPGQTVLGKSIF